MDGFNWLAEIAGECKDFGEKYDLPDVVQGAQAIMKALEKDLGVRFHMLPRPQPDILIAHGRPLENKTNIISFPVCR